MGPEGTGGSLIELVFRSRLAQTDATALARLVGAAWQANLRARVTGEMRIEGRAVAQVVEGAPGVILPLAARILSDPRHAAVEIVAFGPVAARRFDDWRVHLVPGDAAAETAAPAHEEVRATRMKEPARRLRPAAAAGARP